MDMFAEGVQNLLRDDCSKKWLRHNPNDDHNLKELKENVTVALIDDGVDFMNRILAENLGAGRSFNTPTEDDDVFGTLEPYHASTTGHGTLMAYMIRRMCPSVKIFVYKLNMDRGSEGKASFTAKSAADVSSSSFQLNFGV